MHTIQGPHALLKCHIEALGILGVFVAVVELLHD